MSRPPLPDMLEGEELLPPPRQARSRAKRAQVLAAAMRLFGERGYEGASIDALAREAGITTGGFYQLYRSKRQLLRVLMAGFVAELEKLDVFHEAPGAEALAAAVHGVLHVDAAYAGVYRAWREASATDADLAACDRALHAWSITSLTQVFDRLLALPGARPGWRAGQLASLFDALLWQLIATPIDDPDATAEALLRLLQHGLFADT